MKDMPVLIVGADPVGLMLPAELHRRRIAYRIIGQRTLPSTFCKAIDLQPRLLELFEMPGLLEEAVARGIRIRGAGDPCQRPQGRRHAPAVRRPQTLMGLPCGFPGLPQYETEAILAAHLGEGPAAEPGTTILVRPDGHLGDRAAA